MPQDALQDVSIARLFHHYTANLAAWYDLSDANHHFSREVPRRALASPLLFSAVIAFAAIHLSVSGTASMRHTGEEYHAVCVRRLIDLDTSVVSSSRDSTLAAVCLLRSYEILAEDFDPNRHLTGAFALVDTHPIDFTAPSLLRAGFFNYLREDITFSLMNDCPLKIDPQRLKYEYPPVTDEDQLNLVTLLLGQAIDLYFSHTFHHARRDSLSTRLEQWNLDLPAHMQPYCDHEEDHSQLGSFSTICFLHDSHVAAMQYYLVATSLVIARSRGDNTKEVLYANAQRLCALAFTSGTAPVIVNSFGPITFCCRYLTRRALQDELVRKLKGFKKSIGWPVDRIVAQLQSHWHCDPRNS